MASIQAKSVRLRLEAVCFDYRGVLIDHGANNILPGMEELLTKLKKRGIILAPVTRFPLEAIELGALKTYFGENLCSSSGRTKIYCIRELAEKWGIADLAMVAFVDDKPANLILVSQQSEVYALGFRGSDKYPQARDACREQGIAFAEDAAELKHLLLSDKEHLS